MFIGVIAFTIIRKESNTQIKNEAINATLNCSIEDENYAITIGEAAYFNCPECNSDMQNNLRDIIDWSNIDDSVENINAYFSKNGGACKMD